MADLRYTKDGGDVICSPIYSKGRVGQPVVMDQVSFGSKVDPERYPLAAYPLSSIFTIVEKWDGTEGKYVLEDAKGVRLTLRDASYGASCDYLYDAQEWIVWRNGREADKFARKERHVSKLEGHLELLKSILIAQGVRVITTEQAKALGIT